MDLDPRLHFVTATAIVVKKNPAGAPKFLIAKRAAHEKAFPNKWTVPGGKLVRGEYEHLPKRPYAAGQKESDVPQWYHLLDWLVKKEVREEVNVEIENIRYLTDLVFIRPDSYPVVTLSYWAWYKSGEAKPGKDLTECAWVTVEEGKNYDLIEGIWDELAAVEKIIGQ